MADGWIKMRVDLYRDPKVCIMSDHLSDVRGPLGRHVNQIYQCDMTVTPNVTRNAVIGGLLSVWGISRRRGVRQNDDLLLPQATLYTIDDMADLPGMGKAMEFVGWVIDMEDGLIFPRFFAEYNDEFPERKTPDSGATRTARWREKRKKNGVTECDENVTLVTKCDAESKSKSIAAPTGQQLASCWARLAADLFSGFGEDQQTKAKDLAGRAYRKLKLQTSHACPVRDAAIMLVAGKISEADFHETVEESKTAKKNARNYFAAILNRKLDQKKTAAG